MTVYLEKRLRNSEFTMISNEIFFDYELSYGAKGLLCQLISIPDTWVDEEGNVHRWKWTLEGLVELNTMKIDHVRRLLKELVDAGYVEHGQYKASRGRFGDAYYRIYDHRGAAFEKVEEESNKTQVTTYIGNPDLGCDLVKPFDEDEPEAKPQFGTDIGFTDNGAELGKQVISQRRKVKPQVNTDIGFTDIGGTATINNKNNKYKNNIHPTIQPNPAEVPLPEETDGRTDSDEDPFFETLCDVSLNRNKLRGAGLRETEEAYRRLSECDGFDAEKILAEWKSLMDEHTASGRKPKFAKQLCAWLNEKADELSRQKRRKARAAAKARAEREIEKNPDLLDEIVCSLDPFAAEAKVRIDGGERGDIQDYWSFKRLQLRKDAVEYLTSLYLEGGDAA